MTQSVIPNAAARPVKPVLDPGHGDAFTDHMFLTRWEQGEGWTRPEIRLREDIPMHPGMIGLHYGQVIFEGLKAHRQSDDVVATFRPEDHARRFRRSARRLAMPELPDDLFLRAIDEVVGADQEWLSADPAHSLYLRPMMFATEANLMLRPSREYLFLLIAFVAGGFFGDDVQSVSVWVSHERSRAFPGGTGDVKCAGNYAPSFLAQREAQEAGCQQVVWLDAVERKWVEELGGMNLFFVRGQGSDAELVTPELTGTLLPGITRDTVLTLANRLGHRTSEERVSLEQWRRECQQGEITEVFSCGTAAVVTSVGEVKDDTGSWSVGDGRPGPVARSLRQALVDVHHGATPDQDGWLRRVPRKG